MKTVLFSALIALSWSLTPSPALAADQTKAKIITGDSRVTQCISPIHVKQVDGEGRQLPALGFELDPGIHSLQGMAKLNLTYCQVRRESNKTSVPPLQAMFEAGKVYYVGLDHSSKDRADWRIVVWKVENMEG